MENADSFMNVLDVSILPTAPSQSFLSLYTGWCNRSANQQWPAAVTSISLLPAVSALCILQAPKFSNWLRKMAYAAVCLLLLLMRSATDLSRHAARQETKTLGIMVAKSLSLNMQNDRQGASQALPGLGGQTQDCWQLLPQDKNRTRACAAAAIAAAADSRADDALRAAQQVDMTSWIARGNIFAVAAVQVLLLRLLVYQAPVITNCARWRRSRSGVVAAVYFGLALCLAGQGEAAASTCAAVKTVCPAKPVPASAILAPPSATAALSKTPAAAATSPPAAAVPAVPPASYTDTLLAAMGARKEALHIASTPDDDVPQRVDPVPMIPRLSRALEQQMYSKLLAALLGTISDGTKAPTNPKTPEPPKNISIPPASDGLMYLQNTRLRVGMDPRKGGSLTYLSSAVMPPEWSGVNLVNTWDSGRLIQQSYYGCEDGSCWSDKPWNWNPVQGGSWHNAPPKLLSSSNVGGVMSTSSIPRNWGSQGLVDDMTMLTEAQLMGSVVKVRFTMRYTGSAAHPPRHQEVPAVFVDRRLNVLATYTGNAPWTNAPLSFVMPGQTGQYYQPTEGWAAYVDAKSGFGLGIYTPIADQLVAYRIGPEDSTAQHDCSYFAPLITEAIKPNTEFSYVSYIAAGRVDEIRKWFADIAATVQPDQSAQRRISPPRSYADSASGNAVPAPRNLAQAAPLARSQTHGTSSIQDVVRSTSTSSSSNSSTLRHHHATRHDISTQFTPVLLSPQTLVVQSDSPNSKVKRAAQHELLQSRQLPFRLLPGRDMLPALRAPMPVRVSSG